MDRHDESWLVFFAVIVGVPVLLGLLNWLVYR